MDAVMLDELTDLRETIDGIDMQIAQLLIRRRIASQSIQRVKLKNRLPLTDLNRENEVCGHYRLMLGEYGPQISTAILNFSKGN
jgi:chorismate mutase